MARRGQLQQPGGYGGECGDGDPAVGTGDTHTFFRFAKVAARRLRRGGRRWKFLRRVAQLFCGVEGGLGACG
ncbi:hypothetical protein [Oryza sativa Japonica Group]|uniref:Uncharacterized protein n=2 Tax=Oryza sativa subsp. japonica TaxID=39947 RepID=A0A9K3Y7W4_ORYSJ|nr:hypothetical protein [Oryza sativa Japonica Group]BAS71993.1 Os01g0344060 [Oryza sativa Japonica Group]